RRKDVAAAKPNAAHYGLAALQSDFDVHIITQNIDDLHERAGSKNILHLHGEIFKMRSEKNEALIYEIKGDIKPEDKAADGAQLRPAIVWFEEPVPMIERAAGIATTAEIFVVVGTSLAVYPAAGLINYAPRFAHKFVIDKQVPYISGANNITAIEMPATEGVKELAAQLKAFL
ncbi:MAG TPA: Sir2 family NAD-dependent protein deacetylase, partial [Panacibacter sp.]|nr:Sir2 family NAD-dependent protein deacetylase [Panacibacter sp.]